MKKVTQIILAFALSFLAFWVIGWYVSFEPNPFQWHDHSRAIHITFSLFPVLVVMAHWSPAESNNDN